MYKTLYNLAPATCTVCNIIKLGILYVTLHISVIFMQGRLYFTTHIFHPRLRLWNDLSESLMNAKSLDIFKRILLNHYPTTNVPPYYFTGPRKFQVKLQVFKLVWSKTTWGNLFQNTTVASKSYFGRWLVFG